jgi:cellulose synthase/poly-beta-1,6-N-acetylglucosamine synthase-like glycosyltransferase
MLATILFTIGTTLVVIALWPFGPYQLTLVVARWLRRSLPVSESQRGASAQEPETFAICLCAYNEAKVIADKVEDLIRLRHAAGGELEILIYVDGASDDTALILARHADHIRVVIGEGRRGKTYGMNLLVGMTEASILIFTDANVRIEPNAVPVLRRYFADPSIGCVCSDLSYVNGAWSPTASVGSAFWSFNEWSKGLETDTGSVLGADGSLFAIRRGLRRPVPKGLFDDIFVSLGVLSAGYRVVRAPELRAYEIHTTDAGEEFRRKVRISCECMHVHFELWPELRKLDIWNLYKYLGHRLLRWVGGYLLLAGLLVLATAAIVVLGWVVVLGGSGLLILLFAVGLLARLGLTMQLMNVLLAFTANAVGTWRAFRGHRAVSWEPASSARGGRSPRVTQ